MKKDLCEIVILLDRSGSMQGIKTDMEGAIDAFVKDQRDVPGEALLTLVQFNDRSIETVLEAKPLADVPPTRINPAGNTPLLDAIGKTITSVGARLAKTPEEARPERVLFVIVTDGEENSSREYTKDAVKAMIEEQTNAWKWQFAFLGANVDSFSEAGSLGIAKNAAANYTPTAQGVQSAIRSLGTRSRTYRSGGAF